MIPALPAHLAARARPLNDQPVAAGAGVVCWLRVSLRPEDNPAIDAAAALADALGAPLLVYQGLGERYPYANDRLHTFILEGARDLCTGLAARGIRYALHVERPGHRGPVLRDLAERASAIVVDEYPISPWRELTRRVADRAPCPVIAVDASCVVPMRDLPAFDRAFAFRAAHAPRVAAHLAPPPAAPVPAPWSAPLPFAPVDPLTADIPAIVAACAIDHAVAPVPHTRGGWRAAAARWADFRDHRLTAYAGARNDALRPDAVSRMSAYLHFGMISARQIAADCAAIGSAGAAKYADELLTWRELAWGWCLRARHHDHRALPAWAAESWAAHAHDPRAVLPMLTLDRGETGDALWDAAQRGLRVHGELHNNMRMTWGKAFAGWSSDVAQAVARATDLNHRYALDGRDPASIGGILWCFGLFDRPHSPDLPVTGVIRPRPTRDHARRLDPVRYAALTRRPALTPVGGDHPRVAIVGAGPAGAAAARVLADHGLRPVVFDKGRGPGGRTSTRRDGALRFDHGAPGVAHHAPDLRLLALLTEAGLLRDDGEQRRPTDGMSSLVRWLLAGVEVRCGAPVTRLGPTGEVSTDGAPENRFDHVIVAVPAPQAAPLLAPVAPGLAAAAAAVRYAPAIVLLASSAVPFAPPAAGPLAVRVQADRRAAVLTLPEADARAAIDAPLSDLAARWFDAASAALGHAPDALVAHRWRYASVDGPGADGPAYERRWSVCGDWVAAHPDVAGAIASGVAVAGDLLGRLGRDDPGPTPVPAAQLGLFARG